MILSAKLIRQTNVKFIYTNPAQILHEPVQTHFLLFFRIKTLLGYII